MASASCAYDIPTGQRYYLLGTAGLLMDLTEIAYSAPTTQAFEDARIILAPLKLDRVALDRSTTREGSIADLGRSRVRLLYSKIQIPCFTIESALLPIADVDSDTPSIRWYEESSLTESNFCEQFAGLSGVVSQVLAFTRDGETVTLFQRDMPGQVSHEPCGGDGVGFDRIWIPHGYTKTYAELQGVKFALNKRTRLIYDLADYLELPVKEGFFEIHVTVEDDTAETFQKFRATCAELGIKAIQIDLPRGVIPTHLISASFHRGTFNHVQREAESIARLLANRGFKITRIKIESMINHSLVPVNDDDAATRPDSNYFEFHVKIPVPTDEENARAKAICADHGAYLSRNPSNRMSDGIPIKFCTLRIRGKGSQSAGAVFDRFLGDLRSGGFKLSNVLREYTVFDSNLGLDDGWAKSLDQTKFCFSECDHIKLGDCPFAVDYDYIAAPKISD